MFLIDYSNKTYQKGKKEFILNCDLIESMEENPDTTIKLVNGKILIVAESSQEIIDKIISYKRRIYGRFN